MIWACIPNCESQLAPGEAPRRAKLGAQVHAIDFYRKLGYTVSSDEFEDAGIPHVYMERTL